MRTTMDLPDHLMILAKQRAAAEQTSLREVMAEALAQYLRPTSQTSAPGRFLVPVMPSSGGGMLPGIDPCDSSALLEIE
jgi:hypothetical protein